MRAGAFALSLLSVPLNVQVLQTLEEEPMSLFELRRAAGSPPPTTMRGNLKTLTAAGILERRRQEDFPGSVDFELGRTGHDLLAVADVLQAWLEEAPGGPVRLGSLGAKSVIKALVDGWSSAMLRALSARPLALTELSKVISGLSYPSLERRLTALRSTGQIERCSGNGRGTPYAVTDWLRRSVAPIAAAMRWERRFLTEEADPLRRIDVETVFLLPVPLLDLPEELRGRCRLGVELRGHGSPQLAGAVVTVEEGAVASCVSRLEGEAEAWVSGSALTWLDALVEDEREKLEIGGDCALATALLDGLHTGLFRARQRA